MFYKARKKVIKVFDNYTKTVSKAKSEAKYGKGLTILTLKQVF